MSKVVEKVVKTIDVKVDILEVRRTGGKDKDGRRDGSGEIRERR